MVFLSKLKYKTLEQIKTEDYYPLNFLAIEFVCYLRGHFAAANETFYHRYLAAVVRFMVDVELEQPAQGQFALRCDVGAGMKVVKIGVRKAGEEFVSQGGSLVECVEQMFGVVAAVNIVLGGVAEVKTLSVLFGHFPFGRDALKIPMLALSEMHDEGADRVKLRQVTPGDLCGREIFQ